MQPVDSVTRAGRWWRAARGTGTLRRRISALAAAIALVCLVALALLAGRAMSPLLVSSVDDELAAALRPAAVAVSKGRMPDQHPGLTLRVLDISGAPVDGKSGRPLSDPQVRELKAGLPVEAGSHPPMRWHGAVVSTPDGTQRLVVAGAGLVGLASAEATGGEWLLLAALAAAVVAGAVIWLAVGSALRPVGRMRRAVRRLGEHERLPLPRSGRELRELAEEFNTLLDRQREAADRLRRFTGDAAHELRSPVASIRVQAEVAVANPDPDTAHEVLADVLDESERLSTLLDGLLALARSDAGELPQAMPVDLVSEARAAVRRMPEGGPALRVSAAVPEVWARAAHAEVELVLDNLLRNACRYADAQVVVSVLATRSVARVVVDDDGPGVAPEHRERVFDRFYRVSDDRARESGGAGLGLALVAELVRRRGGRVAVNESPDGGARFLASWPAE